MPRLRFLGSLVGLVLSSAVLEAAPQVAVDIAPIHSLVSQVMDGVATPILLIQPEASPHSYSLRPSEARALSKADVVFWMSEGLTPWLEKSLDTLASKAHKVEMIAVEGTTTYAFREGATFEAHEHHDEEDSYEEHHDDQPWHEDDHHEGHEHEGEDPHAWLDPVNAKVWIKKIRDVLTKFDPENAPRYKRNAEKTRVRLDKLIDKIRQETHAMNQLQFIVFHDAYQYFERRFDVLAAGAISLSDAQDPSPARVAEIRDQVKKLNITCVFSEPQFSPGLVNSVFAGTIVKSIGVMDPVGAGIKAGKNQYEELLNSMLNSLKKCGF